MVDAAYEIQLSTPDTLRWLHLSDIHVNTRSSYYQEKTFKSLLDYTKEKEFHPDIIFFTGDIANSGSKDEYQLFSDAVLRPIAEQFGVAFLKRVFLIPGNHDISRDAGNLWTADVLRRYPDILQPTETWRKERAKILFDRFQQYVDADMHQYTAIDKPWLFSSEGVYTCKLTIEGRDTKIGVLGLNTAWASSGADDKENLTPGRDMVSDGLQALKDCDLCIVLGHHAVDLFIDDGVERDAIRRLFAQKNVLYLHGDLQNSSITPGPFLDIQAGAIYQERGQELQANILLQCELSLTKKTLRVLPLRWEQAEPGWVSTGLPGAEQYREGETIHFSFPLPPHTEPVRISGQKKKSKAQSTADGAQPTVDVNKLYFPDAHHESWKLIKSLSE